MRGRRAAAGDSEALRPLPFPAAGPPPEPLTAREAEVLGLLAAGLSNRQLAAALGVTRRTAETHVARILRKLCLASRTQAALWAVDHGVRADHGRPREEATLAPQGGGLQACTADGRPGRHRRTPGAARRPRPQVLSAVRTFTDAGQRRSAVRFPALPFTARRYPLPHGSAARRAGVA